MLGFLYICNMIVNKYMTNQELLDISSEYDRPTHIIKKNITLYNLLQKRGLLNDVKYKVGKVITYTDEEILNEGSKYDSPTDFEKGNPNMYSVAVKHKLNKVINYKKGYKMTYYTDEDIINGGLKYDNPVDYFKNEQNMYCAGQRRGLLNQIKYKVGYIGNRIKRLVYVYEFLDNSVYIGLTYNEKKREIEHSIKGKTTVSKHIVKTGLTPIKKIISDGYIDAHIAQEMENDLITEYRLNGWNILNKVKGGALGGNTLKWTEEVIRERIKECNYVEDIIKKFGDGFVRAAKRQGIYDSITKDLPNRVNYYNKKTAIDTAKNYITRKEFKKDYSGLYSVIIKNKWGNDVFKHMPDRACKILILDTETGIYYFGVKDAYQAKNFKITIDTLRVYLSGCRKNKTSLILV